VDRYKRSDPSDLLDAFLLAERVMCEAYDLKIPAREGRRLWQVWREIADGKLTLHDDPSEMLGRFPRMDRTQLDEMRESHGDLIANDQALARIISDAFRDFVRNFKP
jgi:hypothetical protein